MTKNAMLSPCRKYRFMLERQWDPSKPWVCFIGLNPSTADEQKDDATIRKCIAFAVSWGMGGLQMLNLFSFRATKPLDMVKAHFSGTAITGPAGTLGGRQQMYDFIRSRDCQFVVAAWGTSSNKALRDNIRYRADEITRFLRSGKIDMKYLNANKDGSPQHPLYIPLSMPLHQWGIQ